jgi:hypothetical protein
MYVLNWKKFENVPTHYMLNKNLHVKVFMLYEVLDFPITFPWLSEISGVIVPNRDLGE